MRYVDGSLEITCVVLVCLVYVELVLSLLSRPKRAPSSSPLYWVSVRFNSKISCFERDEPNGLQSMYYLTFASFPNDVPVFTIPFSHLLSRSLLLYGV